jgi:chromosome segregation ATPase
MAEPDNLTVEILRDIRDEVRTTNARIDSLRVETTGLIAETNQRLDDIRAESNERLERLNEGQIRLATGLADLRGEVGNLRGEVGDLRGEVGNLRGEVGDLRGEVVRQGDRLENAILTGGQLIRGLTQRVERLEAHTGLEPPSV